MTIGPFKYVFGPVPSRRLGRSLGIDLVPYKTCSYSCIYCQLGRTVVKTIARMEYVPLQAVLDETEQWLKGNAAPDYITLSGSGEPTLFNRLDELIAGIRRLTRTPIAVLTNGSLLWDPEVRRGLLDADVVIPSLDADSEALFRRVNRPHRNLDFAEILSGMQCFREEYRGQIWLGVFLLKRISGNRAHAEKIAGLSHKLKPDRIQLNTVLRPPSERYALAVDSVSMHFLATVFGDRAEVISDTSISEFSSTVYPPEPAIMGLLCRRPCTIQDVSRSLGMSVAEAGKRLDILVRDGTIVVCQRAERAFYVPSRPATRSGQDG